MLQSRWRLPADRSGLAPLGKPKIPVLVESGADGATHPGVSRPATFELAVASRIDRVTAYHSGAGKASGAIALRRRDGTVYGPWPAAGAVGQGGVANAYRWGRPEIAIPAGRCTVVDSDPGTWSREAATEGSGNFVIWGLELR